MCVQLFYVPLMLLFHDVGHLSICCTSSLAAVCSLHADTIAYAHWTRSWLLAHCISLVMSWDCSRGNLVGMIHGSDWSGCLQNHKLSCKVKLLEGTIVLSFFTTKGYKIWCFSCCSILTRHYVIIGDHPMLLIVSLCVGPLTHYPYNLSCWTMKNLKVVVLVHSTMMRSNFLILCYSEWIGIPDYRLLCFLNEPQFNVERPGFTLVYLILLHNVLILVIINCAQC